MDVTGGTHACHLEFVARALVDLDLTMFELLNMAKTVYL